MTVPLHIEYATIIQKNTEGFREDLVKIAFEKRLALVVANNGTLQDGSAPTVATDVIEYVDTLLAAMEKTPGAPAGDSQRPTRTDDGELLVD